LDLRYPVLIGGEGRETFEKFLGDRFLGRRRRHCDVRAVGWLWMEKLPGCGSVDGEVGGRRFSVEGDNSSSTTPFVVAEKSGAWRPGGCSSPFFLRFFLLFLLLESCKCIFFYLCVSGKHTRLYSSKKVVARAFY
jgi:hypothetical protein